MFMAPEDATRFSNLGGELALARFMAGSRAGRRQGSRRSTPSARRSLPPADQRTPGFEERVELLSGRSREGRFDTPVFSPRASTPGGTTSGECLRHNTTALPAKNPSYCSVITDAHNRMECEEVWMLGKMDVRNMLDGRGVLRVGV